MISVLQFCQKHVTRVSFAAPSFPSYVCLLHRPWPYRVAPAAGESCGAHICPIPCWPCHLMTLMVLQQMSQHFQYQSTARILVPSGPFGPAEQGLLFEQLFCIQIFQTGWERLESILDFDNPSAAIICVDTIKYYSIPSVPSGLEGCLLYTSPSPRD